MVKRLAAAAMLAVVGLTGCTDPIVANRDNIDVYPQVHVESYFLRNVALVVQPPRTSRVPGSGQLRVSIPIRNKTDDDLNVDYIYYFLAANGKQVEKTSGRMFLNVPRKGMAEIEFVSLTPAEDFRVELFHAK